MSLPEEWFADSNSRNEDRDFKNPTSEEVSKSLLWYYSSISPVAVEMVEWVYKNWNLENIYKMSKHDRELLLLIIEKEIINKN